MRTWVVRAQVPGKQPLWVGPVNAVGREPAKRAARLFVSEHLPLDTKILSICEGNIQVTLLGDLIPMED